MFQSIREGIAHAEKELSGTGIHPAALQTIAQFSAAKAIEFYMENAWFNPQSYLVNPGGVSWTVKLIIIL